MNRTIKLSEEEKRNIKKMYGMINEQKVGEENLDNVKITKLSINQNRMGSYVTLSNGKTYKYSEGSNYKLPTMGYTNQCKAGEYTGDNLPQHCKVSVKLSNDVNYTCGSDGCEKDNLRIR